MHHIINKGKNWVKLAIDTRVYSLATVYSSGYVFLDRVYIYLDKDNNKNGVNVWLFPKNKKENLNTLGMDFYNELLNYAHYFSSLRANAEVVKLLTQRAFFSAAPSLVKEEEEKEIEDLIKELEEEEKEEKVNKKAKSKKNNVPLPKKSQQ
jgi:His-Xaa-Ser system protein HxsD